jgi:hypothetical protein
MSTLEEGSGTVSSQRLPRYKRALYGTAVLAGSIVAGADNLGVPDLSNALGVLMEDGSVSFHRVKCTTGGRQTRQFLSR